MQQMACWNDNSPFTVYICLGRLATSTELPLKSGSLIVWDNASNEDFFCVILMQGTQKGTQNEYPIVVLPL